MEITYPLEGVCLHCNSAVLECLINICTYKQQENYRTINTVGAVSRIDSIPHGNLLASRKHSAQKEAHSMIETCYVA